MPNFRVLAFITPFPSRRYLSVACQCGIFIRPARRLPLLSGCCGILCGNDFARSFPTVRYLLHGAFLLAHRRKNGLGLGVYRVFFVAHPPNHYQMTERLITGHAPDRRSSFCSLVSLL